SAPMGAQSRSTSTTKSPLVVVNFTLNLAGASSVSDWGESRAALPVGAAAAGSAGLAGALSGVAAGAGSAALTGSGALTGSASLGGGGGSGAGSFFLQPTARTPKRTKGESDSSARGFVMGRIYSSAPAVWHDCR